MIFTIAFESDLFDLEYPYQASFPSSRKDVPDMISWCDRKICRASIGGDWTVCNDHPNKNLAVFGFKRQDDATLFKLTWGFDNEQG